MNDPKQEIRFLAKQTPKGTTSNGVLCPFCNGGKHAEKSLSLTVRSDGVGLYICHRASCAQAGRVFGNGNVLGSTTSEQQQSEFKPRVWNGETRSLNDDERMRLEHDFGFTYRELLRYRLSVVQEGNFSGRLIAPILGPRGQVRGNIVRVFPGQEGQPKSVTYKELDEPFCGWFQTETSNRNKVVLVEDIFSAIKVARQFVSVALCGCNISQENLFELLKYTDNIIVALDKDATDRALKYKQKYRFLAPQMQVAILERDLKHCGDDEIKERCDI